MTDVGGYVGAEGRVKPYYVSTSRALWIWWLWVEIKVVAVSASFEGFLVRGNGCVKRLFVRRDVRQPSVYGFRYASEHRWRMVAVAVARENLRRTHGGYIQDQI